MTNADTTRPDGTESMLELDHVVIENDDAPDECAIFPLEVSETELLSAWISAQDGAFVALESMQ